MINSTIILMIGQKDDGEKINDKKDDDDDEEDDDDGASSSMIYFSYIMDNIRNKVSFNISFSGDAKNLL